MSKETSSTNRDGSTSVDAFGGLSAYKPEDLPQARVEAPVRLEERHIPSMRVVELYNRNSETDSTVKTEKPKDDSSEKDDGGEEDSDEVKAAKKKRAELAAAGKPVRSVRPPRRVLPSFRPDQLKVDTAETPTENSVKVSGAELTAETPQGAQKVEDAEMPTSSSRETAPSANSFGELPAIEEHEWPDVFIPAQRTESPAMNETSAGEASDDAVLTFPEQFAEAQPTYDDAPEEPETPAATPTSTAGKPVYFASAGPSGSSYNTNPSTPNTTVVPSAQSGTGGGNVPPMPPFTASPNTGGGTPPPHNPNSYHMASGSGGFNALPVATAITGNVVPPIVIAPRIKARDTLARVMATAAGAGAYLGYRANKNKIKKVEKASQIQHQELRTQQERMAIDQRIQQMQTENIQHHMKTMRSPETATATPSRAERASTEQIVPPPAPVAVRPAMPRAEVRSVPDKQAEQSEMAQEAAQDLQANRRVDHSSWHNYVVENGKVVTDAIEYGQGYRQEQREIINDRTGDSVVAASAATGAAGTTAVAGSAGHAPSYAPAGYSPVPSYQPSTLPSGLTAPALPSGQSTHVDPQHMLAADSTPKDKEPATGLAFWIMLIIIVAAFFAAALI